MKKGVWIAIIVGIIVAAVLASPLFYETGVDESLPDKLNEIEEELTFERFIAMDESKRQPIVDNMSFKVQDMIMQKAATITTEISEDMSGPKEIQVSHIGEFEGLIGHDAKGTAKILTVSDSIYLRFENFQITNGPDLRVYLTNNDVKNGVHLDKLKGSKGNQNYLLDGIDWQKYDTVVVYCQPFGVHFGQVILTSTNVDVIQDSQDLFFTLQGDNQIGTLGNSNWDTGPMMTYIDSSNDGSLILATSSGSDTVYAFNSGNLVSKIPVGHIPKGVKIHPEEDMAFVANEGSGTVSVIDMDSFVVIKEI